MRNRDEHARGFTLLELLVVVAIIGIIAAIAIMNFMLALDRARQKRTMNDIRQIASAWEARASETQSYSIAGYTFPTTAVPLVDLETALAPTYIKVLPSYDGWNRPFDFALGGGVKAEYSIRSAGRDGKFDADTYTPGEFSDADCDLVYSSGSFITYPGNLPPK